MHCIIIHNINAAAWRVQAAAATPGSDEGEEWPSSARDMAVDGEGVAGGEGEVDDDGPMRRQPGGGCDIFKA